MKPIDTTRLRIRRFARGDIEPFVSFMTDRKSTAFLPFSDEQKSREGAKELVEATIASYESAHPMLAFAVEDPVSGQFVGFCGLNPHNEETTEIMYAVMPGARQQGYATEMVVALTRYALDDLGYHRAIAFIAPENRYSKLVATKAGFIDHGLVKHALFSEDVHQFICESALC